MAPVMSIGMGCMRLSTAEERDDDRALAVLEAALEAGVTLLDTADAYGHDDDDIGHNERLVGRAVARLRNGRAVEIVTKGGFRRPGGRWVADGRARHLAKACERSLAALGVDRIDLYLLHAPDPRTPFATSVRALAGLERAGLVRAIGLSNVSPRQLEEAREIAPIAAIEVRIGPFDDPGRTDELVAQAARHGIRVLAHSPLGGAKAKARVAREATFAAIAAKHGATAIEIALASLYARGIVPLPGATSPETARSAAKAAGIALDDEDRAALLARSGARRAVSVASLPTAGAPMPADASIVIVMGLPAAGKTSAVAPLVEEGYERLNRDERGGRLAALATLLDRSLADPGGPRRFVLDNTYGTRRTRADVLAVGARHGVPVRCVWIDTPLEEAQVNACERLVARYGALPTPEELARHAKENPNAFGPSVQFRHRRDLEPPTLDEGFVDVEVRRFERRARPGTQKALIVEYDGVLRRSRAGERAPVTPSDVEVIAERGAVLRRWADDGFLLCGIAWEPRVSEGLTTPEVVAACFDRTHEALGVALDASYCPHGAGPPVCWCRKPLPGLGVALVDRLDLDPAQCIHVGRGPADRGFAERLGLRYVDHDAFFRLPDTILP